MCSSHLGNARAYLQAIQTKLSAGLISAAMNLIQKRGGGQVRGVFADQTTITTLVQFLDSL